MKTDDVALRQRVKCVTDRNGYALYFSRGMLPHNKDGVARPFPVPFQDTPYLLHLGLQCYDRAFLAEYCRMPPTPLMVSTASMASLMKSLQTYDCAQILLSCRVLTEAAKD